MRTTRTLIIIAAVSACLSLAIAGCGNAESEKPATDHPTEHPAKQDGEEHPTEYPAKEAASEAEAGVVNVTCPIMVDSPISSDVPASLIREFQGQKVGFCCGGCPGKWDALSDSQKTAKLQPTLRK